MAETRGSVSPINPCVISDKKSENNPGLSEESNESTVSSNVDASSDAVVSSVTVTEEMFEIERQLEEENKAQEQKLRDEAMKAARESKEHCYKRLQHLLNRSNIYAQFLVGRMEKQQETAAKKQLRKYDHQNKQKLRDEQLVNSKRDTRSGLVAGTEASGNPISDGKKRPLKSASNSRSSKRTKEDEFQISDFFDKEDLNAQASKPNESADGVERIAVPDTYSRTIHGERVSDLQPNLVTGGVMRPYQIEALEWLKVLYENGVNGILGDEMGLGKTIECIALIAHLVEMGVAGPYLVICPLSTLYNWCKEFQRFTPEIPVILYHGSKEERAVLRRRLNRKVVVRNKLIYPILVTSYTLIMNDRAFLMHHNWIIIIDEGHRIKNWQCRLVRELKQYRSTNRLLLTGTPLQNNLAELWSLLNFLIPEIFDDLQVFESWFDITAMTEQNDEQIIAQEQEKQIVSTIHQILTPFLLRRTKADVALNLPPKKELIVYAPITPKQRELYTAVADKTIRKLLHLEGDSQEVLGKRRTEKIDFSVYYDERNYDVHTGLQPVLPEPNTVSGGAYVKSFDNSSSVINVTTNNGLMMLRKICNHPYLVEFPLDPRTNDYLIDENMVKVCGKLQVLGLMLSELRKRGHKVLIFSQFVVMLDILDYFCEMRGYPCNRIHGAVKVDERQRLIDDFNENPASFIFLISTRAGGLGINLTRADTVIIYDSDWNPQNDLQAQDRCHRYGQTRPVVVYRLVTANTVDQKIVERACAKRKLEKMIIHNGRFSSCEQMKMTKMITPEELLEILRQSDVSGSMNMENVISPEDLNLLLDRSDMLRPVVNSCHSEETEELTNLTEVKGVFKVVEQVDSCNFARSTDVS